MCDSTACFQVDCESKAAVKFVIKAPYYQIDTELLKQKLDSIDQLFNREYQSIQGNEQGDSSYKILYLWMHKLFKYILLHRLE